MDDISGEAGEVGWALVVLYEPLLVDSGGDASIVDVSGRFERRRWIGGEGIVSGRLVVAGGEVRACDGSGGDSEVEGEVE